MIFPFPVLPRSVSDVNGVGSPGNSPSLDTPSCPPTAARAPRGEGGEGAGGRLYFRELISNVPWMLYLYTNILLTSCLVSALNLYSSPRQTRFCHAGNARGREYNTSPREVLITNNISHFLQPGETKIPRDVKETIR